MSSRDEAQAWTPSDDGIDDLEIDHQRYDPQAGRGFTELLWESETEEFRFYWEYFSRIIALLSGYFVVKTNIIYIDISLSVILTTYLMSVIETQRSYGGLSEKNKGTFLQTFNYFAIIGFNTNFESIGLDKNCKTDLPR